MRTRPRPPRLGLTPLHNAALCKPGPRATTRDPRAALAAPVRPRRGLPQPTPTVRCGARASRQPMAPQQRWPVGVRAILRAPGAARERADSPSKVHLLALTDEVRPTNRRTARLKRGIAVAYTQRKVRRGLKGSVHAGRPHRPRWGDEPVWLRRWGSRQLLGSFWTMSHAGRQG